MGGNSSGLRIWDLHAIWSGAGHRARLIRIIVHYTKMVGSVADPTTSINDRYIVE